MQNATLTQMRASRHPVIGVMLFLLLLLQTLAGSESLHLDLHADAGSAEHQCAVTHFSNGQVDLSCPSVTVAEPVAFTLHFHPAPEVFASEPWQFLLPSRGPRSLA